MLSLLKKAVLILLLLLFLSLPCCHILKTLKGQLPVTLNKMCSHCPQFAFVSSSFFFFCMCPIQSDTHIKILELFVFSQVHKADYFLPHPLIEGIQYNALLSLDTPQHTNWSRVSQL